MNDKQKLIVELANEGKPSGEIARRLGYQLKTVQNLIAVLRRQGLIKTQKVSKSATDPMGDFLTDFYNLPVPVQEWLEAQAEDGLTVSQVVLLCAKDAFTEEHKVKFTQPLRSVA